MKKRIISIGLVAALTATLFAGCGSNGAKSTGEEVNIFVWTEYVSEDAIKAFEDETGIKVNVSTFSSNEDMLSKVKSESEGTYDVVQPSDYMVEQMIAQGMLEKLNLDDLSNLSNVGEAYLDPSYDPGNVYSVPYQGGVAAIAVNTAKIEKEITSYDDLFDSSLKGQIVCLDDYRAVIGMTARSMGLSMNETDPDNLKKIEEKLLTLKDNVALYDSDSPKSALISGDAAVGYIWSAEIALAMEENPDIEIVYPSEGAYVFLDNWCIPKGAKNTEAATKFINFMLGKEAAQKNIEAFPYLTVNQPALEAMGDEYVANAAKNPPQEEISKGEFVTNLDTDTMAIYDEMWTKLKQ